MIRFCMVAFFLGFSSQAFSLVTDSAQVSAVIVADSSNGIQTVDSSGASQIVERPTASLLIKTEPDTAAVILDDSLRGLSPLTISDIDTGKHTLILKKTGYYLKKVEFRIDSGAAQELSFVLTAPGRLSLTSEPSGARLIINKDTAGVTPYNASSIKPGKYRIKAQMNDYDLFDSTLTINSGGSSTLNIVLNHTTAYLDSLKQIREKATA